MVSSSMARKHGGTPWTHSSGPRPKETHLKKTRFTEAQIVAILKELDAGTAATELARRHGIHANTIRLWRDKYAGLETSDLDAA